MRGSVCGGMDNVEEEVGKMNQGKYMGGGKVRGPKLGEGTEVMKRLYGRQR